MVELPSGFEIVCMDCRQIFKPLTNEPFGITHCLNCFKEQRKRSRKEQKLYNQWVRDSLKDVKQLFTWDIMHEPNPVEYMENWIAFYIQYIKT